MTNEERAIEAVEHLQAAAKELIAAARAVLDVAEDLVDHPDAVLSLLGELAAPLVARGRAAASDGRHDDGAPESPRVQHIRVS